MDEDFLAGFGTVVLALAVIWFVLVAALAAAAISRKSPAFALAALVVALLAYPVFFGVG